MGRLAGEYLTGLGFSRLVYMPSDVQGKERKLARPYYGPYRVLQVTPTNAEVVLIDKPRDPSIFVSLSRVRKCYEEMADETWTGPREKRKRKSQKRPATPSSSDPPPLTLLLRASPLWPLRRHLNGS